MSLTRKHFVDLAKMMQRIHTQANSPVATHTVIREVERELVDFCKQHCGYTTNGNKRFDEQRFLEACHNQ